MKTEYLEFRLKKHLQLFIMLACVILLILFLSSKSPYFFTPNNFINVLEASSYKLILAAGMTFIIAMGNIDLSVGSIISLCGIFLAVSLKGGAPPISAIAVSLVVGFLMGSFNGAVVHCSGLNPLIITHATSWIYRGIALIVTKGIPITKLGKEFLKIGNGNFLGTKTGVVFSLLFILLCFPILNNFKWGHYIKSIGANETSLKITGVKTGFYKIATYGFMGVCAAFAAIIITSKLNSAEPNAGLQMEFDAITAVIMGGTPLSGGKATLAGTVVAVFLLGLIRNGLTILSVSPFYQQLITGVILLLCVVATVIKQKK